MFVQFLRSLIFRQFNLTFFILQNVRQFKYFLHLQMYNFIELIINLKRLVEYPRQKGWTTFRKNNIETLLPKCIHATNQSDLPCDDSRRNLKNLKKLGFIYIYFLCIIKQKSSYCGGKNIQRVIFVISKTIPTNYSFKTRNNSVEIYPGIGAIERVPKKKRKMYRLTQTTNRRAATMDFEAQQSRRI